MSVKYFSKLSEAIFKTEVDGKGVVVAWDEALRLIRRRISGLKVNNKIIIIGNGGSASIASHIATDFLKNAAIPALAFNDSSLLTCLGNDLGYENVFAKPIAIITQRGDILLAISSSGKSANILNGVDAALKKGCFVITLSGFTENNPLRKKGSLNFYVPSNSYGYVEIAHLAICHLIADIFKK